MRSSLCRWGRVGERDSRVSVGRWAGREISNKLVGMATAEEEEEEEVVVVVDFKVKVKVKVKDKDKDSKGAGEEGGDDGSDCKLKSQRDTSYRQSTIPSNSIAIPLLHSIQIE
jgi:hypothetical protein